MRISGSRNWALASSKFSLRTHLTYSGANFITGRSTQADQIGHEAVGADGTRGQLTPQPEANVHPAAPPDTRFDERAGLDPAVVFEGIRGLQQVHIALVALAQEIQPALLHPTAPRLGTEL